MVKKSIFVYMEYYTSILNIDLAELNKFYEKEIILADREMIENNFDEEIMIKAIDNDVSLLVVGDPFSATTHMDLYLRCIQKGVKVEVINNASIMNSCGITGLSLYRFGETVTIPYFTKTWKPFSFYQKIVKNYTNDFHTLVLLDIKVKEISDENMAKGKKIYEPPRFMSINIAIEQILESVEIIKNSNDLNDGSLLINENSLAIGVARIGAPDQLIVSGKLKDLKNVEFGTPLHSLIICAPNLHSMEKQMFEFYSNNKI